MIARVISAQNCRKVSYCYIILVMTHVPYLSVMRRYEYTNEPKPPINANCCLQLADMLHSHNNLLLKETKRQYPFLASYMGDSVLINVPVARRINYQMTTINLIVIEDSDHTHKRVSLISIKRNKD